MFKIILFGNVNKRIKKQNFTHRESGLIGTNHTEAMIGSRPPYWPSLGMICPNWITFSSIFFDFSYFLPTY